MKKRGPTPPPSFHPLSKPSLSLVSTFVKPLGCSSCSSLAHTWFSLSFLPSFLSSFFFFFFFQLVSPFRVTTTTITLLKKPPSSSIYIDRKMVMILSPCFFMNDFLLYPLGFSLVLILLSFSCPRLLLLPFRFFVKTGSSNSNCNWSPAVGENLLRNL